MGVVMVKENNLHKVGSKEFTLSAPTHPHT